MLFKISLIIYNLLFPFFAYFSNLYSQWKSESHLTFRMDPNTGRTFVAWNLILKLGILRYCSRQLIRPLDELVSQSTPMTWEGTIKNILSTICRQWRRTCNVRWLNTGKRYGNDSRQITAGKKKNYLKC